MDDSPLRQHKKLAALLMFATGMAGCTAPNSSPRNLSGLSTLPAPVAQAEDSHQNGAPVFVQAASPGDRASLKSRKIKAVNYLAKVSCSCSGTQGDITQALIAALGDGDEQVRLATIQAIMTATENGSCETCGAESHCRPELVEHLAKMAFEADDEGAWIEPSERVRQLAAQAATVCHPRQPAGAELSPVQPELAREDTAEQPTEPAMSSESAVPEAATEAPSVPLLPVAPEEAARAQKLRERAIAIVYAQPESLEDEEIPGLPEGRQLAAGASKDKADDDEAPGRAFIANYEDPIVIYRNLAVPSGNERWSPGHPGESVTRVRRPTTVSLSAHPGMTSGVVRYVDPIHGTAQVDFARKEWLAPGTQVLVEHKALFGRLTTSGTLEVVSSDAGSATMKAVGEFKISQVASGDIVYVVPTN